MVKLLLLSLLIAWLAHSIHRRLEQRKASRNVTETRIETINSFQLDRQNLEIIRGHVRENRYLAEQRLLAIFRETLPSSKTGGS